VQPGQSALHRDETALVSLITGFRSSPGPWQGAPAGGTQLSALDLSRWQFGIVTVYHFIFVPLTIGLLVIVAGTQTACFIKKDPQYLQMTKFFGKLFLTNFAVGVVTDIVQEFQFGMSLSAYSRFVGDVFGAPL
jgi:cytochrome bd ubiquinol oxidase subunit I